VRPERLDRGQQYRRHSLISAPGDGRPARALDPVERLRVWRREHPEAVVEQPVADRALEHSSTEGFESKRRNPPPPPAVPPAVAQVMLVWSASGLPLRMTFGGIGSYQTRDQTSGVTRLPFVVCAAARRLHAAWAAPR
jgi:hypothetical protein